MKWRDHLGNEYPSMSAMCRAYNIRPQTFSLRYDMGWTMEDCLFGKHITYAGKQFNSLHHLCRELGLKYSTVYKRIQQGWSIEDAVNTPEHVKRSDYND